MAACGKSRFALIATAILAQGAFAAPPSEIRLKNSLETGAGSICLSELIEAHTLPARETEKLSNYCRIEIKSEKVLLQTKDIELYVWAAGVIPDKILGGPVVVRRIVTSAPKNPAFEKTRGTRMRRGSSITLILRSQNMVLSRSAVLLADGFPGETVAVRPEGTRKMLRAKLAADGTAEVVP
ncbi:MAG: flagella basal body P-ring formation protein FlgA [Leptospiraceae bacterium]|nr:flagella basal body P-ring formation protein FlgA [Leptospiraceae bacterium]